MSLADMVAELEEDLEGWKEEAASLGKDINELEDELAEVNSKLSKLEEFYKWVEMAYPEIVKDYGCVKIIEEVANEHG